MAAMQYTNYQNQTDYSPLEPCSKRRLEVALVPQRCLEVALNSPLLQRGARGVQNICSTKLAQNAAVWLICIVLVCQVGCTWSTDSIRRVASVAQWGTGTGVDVRRRPRNPLEMPMSVMTSVLGRGGLQPCDRTEQYLWKHVLLDRYKEDPESVLLELVESTQQQPDLEQLRVLSELAYIQGHRSRLSGNERRAGQMLATSVIASFEFLFNPNLDPFRNAYDPQFRQVCDIYNQGLEGMLRIMRSQELLRPGGAFEATSLGGEPIRILITLEGRWQNEQFEKFEFVSDFDAEGLRNNYHTYGLGVPLIAVRRPADSNRPEEQYYPPGLTLPMTAFFRVDHESPGSGEDDDALQQCVVQLYDPLEQTEVQICDRFAPLESNISTPLAYYLDDPLLNTNWFATLAMLNGDFAKKFRGLYMLEPFDPNKIPVVMVHGFWSSPMTWTEMFNDLRADKLVRDNYQFWFYMYPSGQPFWFSARQMRLDLQRARETLDPNHDSNLLDQMVLVGHSMGGLVSRLQTLESADHFWNLVSDRRVDELNGDDSTINDLHQTLFFEPNPSVARVITLGTPHRGSNVANSLTRWIGHKLFRLPSNLTNEYSGLVKDNPDFFRNPDLLTINTSIDSLATDSPFFGAMQSARRRSGVRYHNVVGLYRANTISTWLSGAEPKSDGVVNLESAKTGDASSEVMVSSEHSLIHQHPRSILEVRRILTEHLAEVDRPAPQSGASRPVSYERADQERNSGRLVPLFQRD